MTRRTLSWQNWGCSIDEFKKKNAAFFPKLDVAFEKNQIKLKGELNVEAKGDLQFLQQEFERYFPDLSNTELLKWKMTKNVFRLNNNILFED